MSSSKTSSTFSALRTLAARLDDDHDDNAHEDEDDDSVPRRPQMVAQSLSSPLVDTPLLKIAAVLSGRHAHSRLRSGAHFGVEERFVKAMKSVFPRHDPRPWTARRTVDFIRLCERVVSGFEMCSFDAAEMVFTAFKQNWCKNLDVPSDPPTQPSVETVRAWNAFRGPQLAWNQRRSLSASADSRPFRRRIAGTWCVLTAGFVAWELSSDTVIYGTADMFLAVHDALRVRFSVLLGLDCISQTSALIELTPPLIRAQMLWQERVIDRYGNPGYEIVKAPEALWKCYSSRLAGGSYEEFDAYARMLEKTRTKERALGAVGEFLTDDLNALIVLVTEVGTAVEMSGLIKFSGHPIIDPISSGASAKTCAKGPDKTDPRARNDCVFTLCHLILKNYIVREGRWPPISFSRDGTKLESLRQRAWLDVDDSSYPLTDWEHAQFGAFLEFDYHEDYLPLIKDKSCAPPLSELDKFYKGGRDTPRALRRLLLRVLKEDDIDTKDLIRRFAEDEIDPDDLLIVLYPKECEFKIAARMYSMLSLRCRLFFSIVQENVKEGVFRYLPYTSMVMSNAELQETLLRMTGPAGDEVLFIEIDLSRWNLYFRDNLIRPIGERFDAIFGLTGVFGRAHEIFFRSTICTLVKDSRVDPLERHAQVGEESDNFWRDHEGGFEGIDQATWTAATIAMIYRALKGENVRFKLLGQGDNQTLALVRNPGSTERLPDFSNRIMAKIEIACAELNHVAKPDEFINSTVQLTYSKVFYISGRCYPMTLKYAAQISPITSADVVTVSDALGSLYSASVGAAMNAHDPLAIWKLGMIHANQLLEDCTSKVSFLPRKHSISRLFSSSDSRILSLCVPSVIGGFPISTACNFICRNEPDQLTSALAFLQLLGLPETKRYLVALTKDDFYSPSPRMQALLRDPFALPLISPGSAATLMHEASLPLVRRAQNRDIQQLVNWSVSRESSELLEALCSIRPFFPVVFRDIYDVSALGRAEEIQRMFTLTRTFIQASRTSKIEWSILSADSRASLAVSVRFAFSCGQNSGRLPFFSSVEQAQRLRLRWGMRTGALQGIEAEHPFDHPPRLTTGQTSGVVCHFSGATENWRIRRGPEKIYLGGKTMERRVASGYELKPVPALSSLKRLVLASTAGEMTSDVWEIFQTVCATRTPHTLEALCQILPRTTGGIIAHRYDSMVESNLIGPIGNLGHGAYIALSSDSVEGVSGGKVDYPVAFQQFYSHLSALARMMLLSGCFKNQSIVIPLCADDMSPLVQERLDVVEKGKTLTPISIDITRNKFCFVPEVDVILASNPYRGRTLDATDALRKADLFMAGAIITEQLTSPLSRARLELSDDSRPSTARLDVAAYEALGSKRVHRALIIAGAWIVAFNYFRLRGDLPTRFSVTSLVTRVSNNLHGYLTSNVLRDSSTLPWVTRKGYYRVRGGPGGVSMANESYARVLSEGIVSYLFGPEFCESTMMPVLPALGRGLDKILVARVFFSRAVWILSMKTDVLTVGSSKNILHNIASTLRTTQHVEQATLLEATIKMKLLLHAMDRVQGRDILVDAMNYEVISQNLCGVQMSVEEMFRAVRVLKRVPELPPSREILFREARPAHPISFTVHAVLGPHLSCPWELAPSLRPHEPLAHMCDMSFRLVGKFATSWCQWADVVPWGSGNALVVGTGAGGLQRLLGSRGWGSEGLDLAKTIPTEIRQRGKGSPPECRLYHPKGIYARESLNTSGDWFDSDVSMAVLTRMNPDLVVIDIEIPTRRPCIELIRPLLRFGYVSRVFFSIWLTLEELSHVIPFVRGCGRNVKVYRISTGEKQPSWAKYVIRTNLVAGKRLQSSSTLCVPDVPSRLELTRPLDTIGLSDLLQSLCGEFVSGAKTLDDAVMLLEDRLADSVGRRRGIVDSPRFIAILESLAAGRAVRRAIEAPDRELALKILLNEAQDPTPLRLSSMLYDIVPGRHSEYYSQNVRRTGSRLIGLYFGK